MAELLGQLTDDEDMLELIDILSAKTHRKTFRNRANHFEKWNSTEFIRRFRLSKDGVMFVHDKIKNDIANPTVRNHAVSSKDMLLVTLSYFATGSFLQVVGDFTGIDKSTASRIVHKVSRAIAKLINEFIKMPETEEERRTIAQEFYKISQSIAKFCLSSHYNTAD